MTARDGWSALQPTEASARLGDDQAGCGPVPLVAGTLLNQGIGGAPRDEEMSPGVAYSTSAPRGPADPYQRVDP